MPGRGTGFASYRTNNIESIFCFPTSLEARQKVGPSRRKSKIFICEPFSVPRTIPTRSYYLSCPPLRSAVHQAFAGSLLCLYVPLATTPLVPRKKNGIAENFVSLVPHNPYSFAWWLVPPRAMTKQKRSKELGSPISSNFPVAVANAPSQPREPPCPLVGMSWLTGQFPPWSHAGVLDSLLLADVRSRTHLFFSVFTF